MNSNIQKLCEIANKPERRIIGLMSGTSLDGLDVALCNFKGHGKNTEVTVIEFAIVPYCEEFKDEIRKVFAKETIELAQLCVLNPWIGTHHGEMVLQCLKTWNIDPSTVDVIASHGQTVYHAPKSFHGNELYPNSTLQIGDGDHVAVKTGIITISDFRQKHIAAGGEGAPLALYGDYLLFSKSDENRILLNAGGIANFTYLPGTDFNSSLPPFATDIGPGNTLLDFYARDLFGLDCDENSRIAKKGIINGALLSSLKNNPFFSKPFPKTTGPETFSPTFVAKCQHDTQTKDIKPEDLMRTLTRFTAETVAEAISKCCVVGGPEPKIYTSGGGNHNPLLADDLIELFNGIKVQSIDSLGIPGDAKEAVLFALLANEALCGSPIKFPNRPEVPSVSMGKFSFPL